MLWRLFLIIIIIIIRRRRITRSTQRAQTSAEREHNKIVAVFSGSESWSGTDCRIRIEMQIVTKIELIGPWVMPYPSKKFRQNPFTTFSVIRRTDKTDRTKNITSFFGRGNKDDVYSVVGLQADVDLWPGQPSRAASSPSGSIVVNHIHHRLFFCYSLINSLEFLACSRPIITIGNS